MAVASVAAMASVTAVAAVASIATVQPAPEPVECTMRMARRPSVRAAMPSDAASTSLRVPNKVRAAEQAAKPTPALRKIVFWVIGI
jgi:hypothetical protein